MYVRVQDLAYIFQDYFDTENLKHWNIQQLFRELLKKALEYLYLMHFLPRKPIPHPEQKVMKLHSVMTVKRKMR